MITGNTPISSIITKNTDSLSQLNQNLVPFAPLNVTSPKSAFLEDMCPANIIERLQEQMMIDQTTKHDEAITQNKGIFNLGPKATSSKKSDESLLKETANKFTYALVHESPGIEHFLITPFLLMIYYTIDDYILDSDTIIFSDLETTKQILQKRAFPHDYGIIQFYIDNNQIKLSKIINLRAFVKELHLQSDGVKVKEVLIPQWNEKDMTTVRVKEGALNDLKSRYDEYSQLKNRIGGDDSVKKLKP